MTSDAGDCPGCAHPHPRELKAPEFELIPKCDRKLIESSPGRPLICGYCGCVYIVNTPPVVFGHLNNPLSGAGWVRKHKEAMA
jgi:hypothetical protein